MIIKKMKHHLKLSTLMVLIFTSCSQPETKHEKGFPISPYLFGQNLWLTSGAEGRTGYIQESLWPKVKESGVTLVRIGGHGYDVNLPGIDTLEMWVKSIKEIGAEPLFQAPRYDPVEKTKELIIFFNIENDYNIKYWAIGNEPYHLGKLSIDSISDYIKIFATAMKSIDPTIKIFVPDAAAYYEDLHQALLLDNRKSVAGMDENGNWYIDGVVFHNYPNAKDYNRSDVIFNSVSKMRGMIMNLISDIEMANEKYARHGEDKLLWGITEFNITYNNPDDHGIEGIAVPSFINGQFWVDIFGLAMEYGAFTVTPWCIQESDRTRTYFGYVGGPPDFHPHSTYYHMKLMAENFKGNYIKMHTDHPYVKAFGSVSADGVTILLMNQDNDKSFRFNLRNLNRNVNNELTINAETGFEAHHDGTIEANSTLVLVFENTGKLKKHITYNIDLARENKEPEIITP